MCLTAPAPAPATATANAPALQLIQDVTVVDESGHIYTDASGGAQNTLNTDETWWRAPENSVVNRKECWITYDLGAPERLRHFQVAALMKDQGIYAPKCMRLERSNGAHGPWEQVEEFEAESVNKSSFDLTKEIVVRFVRLVFVDQQATAGILAAYQARCSYYIRSVQFFSGPEDKTVAAAATATPQFDTTITTASSVYDPRFNPDKPLSDDQSYWCSKKNCGECEWGMHLCETRQISALRLHFTYDAAEYTIHLSSDGKTYEQVGTPAAGKGVCLAMFGEPKACQHIRLMFSGPIESGEYVGLYAVQLL